MSLDVYLYLEVDSGNGIKKICVYDANLTHNLNRMAHSYSEEFYKALWRPGELFANPTARDIAPIIEGGLEDLIANPAKYEPLNPPNGWGS